jgi:hypothetical protein
MRLRRKPRKGCHAASPNETEFVAADWSNHLYLSWPEWLIAIAVAVGAFIGTNHMVTV